LFLEKKKKESAMLTGYYSSISGVHYNEQKLDVISNNLANMSTPGFRRSMLMVRSREENEFTNRVDRDVKERLPDYYGTQRTGIYKIYKKTGKLQSTGNSFDLAIPPELKNAFFAVRGKDANDPSSYYTRNGSLSLNNIDPKIPGSPSVLYLGNNIALDGNNQPISVDPSLGELKITDDGTIKQGQVEVGKIPVYRLNKSADPTTQVHANLQLLQSKGDSLFQVPEKHQDEFHPHAIEVGVDGVTRTTVQGSKESSNVSTFQELAEMLTAQRTAQASKQAVKDQISSLTKLFQMARG
jgi:flagellar basal body rod protein FlgG